MTTEKPSAELPGQVGASPIEGPSAKLVNSAGETGVRPQQSGVRDQEQAEHHHERLGPPRRRPDVGRGRASAGQAVRTQERLEVGEEGGGRRDPEPVIEPHDGRGGLVIRRSVPR